MELIGFCVDRKKLEELAAEATQERDNLKAIEEEEKQDIFTRVP